jgi:hypothetical protein
MEELTSPSPSPRWKIFSNQWRNPEDRSYICAMTAILFYSLVLFCFILELNTVFNPVKEFELGLKTREALEAKTEYSRMSKDVQINYLNQLFYWVVCMVGVFTSQWPVFLAIILLSFVSKFYRNYLMGKWVDSILCSSLLLFAIINRFHVHYDIGELIIKTLGV